MSLKPMPKAENPPACTHHSLVDPHQNVDVCTKESQICVRPGGTEVHASSRLSEEQGSVETQVLEFTEEVNSPTHDGIVVTYDVWRTVEESAV